MTTRRSFLALLAGVFALPKIPIEAKPKIGMMMVYAMGDSLTCVTCGNKVFAVWKYAGIDVWNCEHCDNPPLRMSAPSSWAVERQGDVFYMSGYRWIDCSVLLDAQSQSRARTRSTGNHHGF